VSSTRFAKRPEPAAFQAPAYEVLRSNKEVQAMPTWLWVLIIVLVILALFGGVGYRRW
jgi:hypothetical protein